MGIPINVGSVDRVVRLLGGAALVFVGLVTLDGLGGDIWGILAAVVGVVFLVTGATKRCPIFGMFGISSIPRAR